MRNIFMLFVLLSSCSTETIYEKHPNQIENIKIAPSFDAACKKGSYGEWANGFACHNL